MHHRGMESIGIYFEKDGTIQNIIQKQCSGKWSRTKRCWYIPCTRKDYKLLAGKLSGNALLEVEELRKYLVDKKKNFAVLSVPIPEKAVEAIRSKPATANPSKPDPAQNAPHRLSKENREALQQFRQ